MATYFTAANQRIVLGALLKEGGEGAVYRVQGNSTLVAKIYRPAKTAPEPKLAWMVVHPPEDPTIGSGHTSIAWPKTLLYDASRQFAGFLMPRIDDAVTLFEVFNPNLRNKVLPKFDRRYLHRTAANFASAMSALHDKRYVIGDVNEGNCYVSRDARVTILDTDSFQVTVTGAGGASQVFPCPVGKPEYLPPELQGGKHANVVRTPHTDTFALAILIFQLLMEGNHPYRSRWLGQGDPPQTPEKISRGFYPHQKPHPAEVAPSSNMPSIDILHPGLVFLFQRSFVDGNRDPSQRPSAEAWERAIKNAEQALIDCPNGHVYSNHQSACPWCAAPTHGVQRPLPPVPRAQPTPSPPLTPIITPFASATPAPLTPTPAMAAPSGLLPRFLAWLGHLTARQKTLAGAFVAVLLVLALVVRPFSGGSSNNQAHVFVPPPTTVPTVASVAQAPTLVATATQPPPTSTPLPTPTPSPDPLGGGCWTTAQVAPSLSVTGAAKPIEQWAFPPARMIVPGKTYTASIVTSRGTIDVRLLTTQVPTTANNFVCLARAGFFDGTKFDRILPGQVLQAGDPTGTGQGGPGYHFAEEPVVGGYIPGALAMVNNGPGSTGSQFFIFLGDLSSTLPARYTIFGHVTSGLAIADAIGNNPTQPATIERVTITESPPG